MKTFLILEMINLVGFQKVYLNVHVSVFLLPLRTYF